MRVRRFAWSVLMVLTATLLIALAVGSASQAAGDDTGGGYRAEIRRTAHGIPHVKADDYGGLGFGYGYAFAEDNVCELAREILTGLGVARASSGPMGPMTTWVARSTISRATSITPRWRRRGPSSVC